MNAARILSGLGPIDLKSTYRDSLLRWVLVFPLLVTIMLRWGIPYLAGYLAENYQFDLAPYFDLILSFNLLLMPSLVGVVIGFLLLDQRDDGTLTALQVSPLSLQAYLAYRISVPMLLSIVATMPIFWIAGLRPTPAPALLAAVILAAPFAPIYALFLGSFARNKVQGFALGKAAGVVLWPPILAYFIDSDWQILFGFLPTYWPAKFFWLVQVGDPAAWLYLPAGLLYQALLLLLLLRRFKRVVHR